jgi:hypothetical protein
MNTSASANLHWLLKTAKWLPIPKLLFSEKALDGAVCGIYYPPSWKCNHIVPIDGVEYHNKNGIIVINTSYPENIESTMAHEFRHHWQIFSGWKLTSSLFDSLDFENDWTNSVIRYYKEQPYEMDALRYQNKMVRSEAEKWVESLVIESK